MSTNPYQSPSELPREPDHRPWALWSLRIAVVLLVGAGLLNYAAFDATYLANRFPRDVAAFYRGANLIGITLVAVFCWEFLFPVLVRMGQLVRRFVAPQVDAARWDDAFYKSLKPAALLAIPGALLWCVWVVGFYHLRMDFMTLSIAVGVPAHLLAAGLYIPLIVRWFKLSREETAETTRPTEN